MIARDMRKSDGFIPSPLAPPGLFHPSLPNAEGFDRSTVASLLPRDSEPKLASKTRQPCVIVVAHDRDVNVRDMERKLGMPQRATRNYLEPRWEQVSLRSSGGDVTSTPLKLTAITTLPCPLYASTTALSSLSRHQRGLEGRLSLVAQTTSFRRQGQTS